MTSESMKFPPPAAIDSSPPLGHHSDHSPDSNRPPAQAGGFSIGISAARPRNLSRRSRYCCRFNLLLASVDSFRSLPASQDSPPGCRFLHSPDSNRQLLAQLLNYFFPADSSLMNRKKNDIIRSEGIAEKPYIGRNCI